MKTLKLTLSKLPFEVMKTGEKKIEYRKPSDWIKSRLIGKNYDAVEFVNGYGKDKPKFTVKFLGFDVASKNENLTFSNGLSFTVEKGDYRILLGEIL